MNTTKERECSVIIAKLSLNKKKRGFKPRLLFTLSALYILYCFLS